MNITDPRHPLWSTVRDNVQLLIIAAAILILAQDRSTDEVLKILAAGAAIFGPSLALRSMRKSAAKKEAIETGTVTPPPAKY